MGYYPIFLDMAERNCLVIGGGSVAQRKVLALLEAGARVTVISPHLTSRLLLLARSGTIVHRARNYVGGDVSGYELCFVAVDDPEVAAAVFGEGRGGVWVNAADDAAHCDFTLPAVLRRGRLVVAVGTGGASPAVSRAIRDELESYFSPDHATLVEIAAEVREILKRSGESTDAAVWHRALQGNVRKFVAQGELEKARTCLLEALGRKE